MQLIQIVPRLRQFDGVADYARLLGRRLREARGVTSAFVAVEAGDGSGSEVPVIAERSSSGLAAALTLAGGAGKLTVLLHYVGYGYALRGAPRWLARAIAQTRRQMGYRLGVVFHELYASGPPWTSAFWLHGLQKAVVRQIAAECDCALVTREPSRQWLERSGAVAGKKLSVLAVCSNVGEPAGTLPASERPVVLAVWGGSAAKAVLYGDRWPVLEQACRTQRVSAIVDLGPRAPRYPSGGPAIEVRGPLPPDDVSRALLGARFGVLSYPTAFLSKSSVFGGYAAHGLVPLIDEVRPTASQDGLEVGRHFVALSEAGRRELVPAQLDGLSRHVRDWYAPHTSAHHAEVVWQLLGASA